LRLGKANNAASKFKCKFKALSLSFWRGFAVVLRGISGRTVSASAIFEGLWCLLFVLIRHGEEGATSLHAGLERLGKDS
jgi:hypothetical protein